MKTAQIIDLKTKGYGRDAVYQFAAGELGLFGVAFFGHRGKSGDRVKLNRVWNRIVNVYNKSL
jgi:hypothetical protein